MPSLFESTTKSNNGDGNGYRSAYCVTKAAINMVAEMLTNELAKEKFMTFVNGGITKINFKSAHKL
jgi:NAD(P)-dependent dehydrogenase (short-subunit alcohol dehydrogenase family)